MDPKYTPAYEPANAREPTEGEKKVDNIFQKFIEEEIKLESNNEMIRRDGVLLEVRSIFLAWVQFIATAILKLPNDVAEECGGELFISGSHRLGVRDIGADIDTVCVAPNFCTREHFFTYLKEDFLKKTEVTQLTAVEDAFVPIISFEFRGVSIDLLFARLATNTVPRELDILDDNILLGLDDATEKSLNGPRVTNMIFKLVGEKTFPNFLIVLRCIRKWAKKRGIYGNKLGYLGGVNCNILVAFICQLYPHFTPSALLFRFFKQYKTWKWPEPIMLNNIQAHPPGQLASLGATSNSEGDRKIWNPIDNANDLMPIITPAYPAMNSSYNVNTHSLAVIQYEINRGYEICENILKKNAWQDMNNWKKIFDPSDFFVKYPHYLACHIIGTGENPESRSWIGFLEARIRRFIQYPFLGTLPLQPPIHLHPVVSKTEKSENSICYFIGFTIDYDAIAKIGDNNLHIDECVSRFQESLLDSEKGYKGDRVEGLDFYVEHLTWKKLPKEVFEIYGGYEAAKQMRDELGYGKRVQIDLSAIAVTSTVANGENSSGIEGNVVVNADGTTTILTAEQLRKQKIASLAAANRQQSLTEKLKQIKQQEFDRKCWINGFDVAKLLGNNNKNGAVNGNNEDNAATATPARMSFEELKKRFYSAAVGVEVNKRRKTEPYIINDIFALDNNNDRTLNKEKEVKPFMIPTITWNLLDNR